MAVNCKKRVRLRMELFSGRILSFLVENTSLPEDETDVYKYGIEITISSLFNIILIIMLSLIFGSIVSGICFLSCFILLRQFTGGYHAESYFKCNLALAVSYTGITLINKRFSELNIYIVVVFLVIGCITVALFAPVNNRHKKLMLKQKQRFKCISLVIYAVFSIASIILRTLNINVWTIISLTLLLVSLMIVIEIYLQKEGYHES